MSYYIMPKFPQAANGMYMFEKKIKLASGGKGQIKIFAASRYILYINGNYVCEGPCRSHQKIRYYDSVEFEFENGDNFIEVKVLHSPDFFTTVYDSPVPMLTFEAKVGDELIVSDETWECRHLRAYELVRYGMKSLPPYEIVNACNSDVRIDVVKGDRCAFEKDGALICAGAALSFLLKERPIPMIYPGDEIDIKPIKSGDGFKEYDAGTYSTAKLKFNIAKNSSVKIIYSECYEFEDGKKKRDDTTGTLKGYYDIVKTDDKDIVYEPFWFRTFRFIRIEGDCDAIGSIKAYKVNYPYKITGTFECSDESYNKMVEVCQRTLLCCAHEIIMDCPYYEQQQYQMDSCVQIAVTSRMTDDTRLAKKCIEEFAHSQMPGGLLLSIAPSSSVLQLIPGFSLIWVMMLKDYLDNTADKHFVGEQIGVMDGILNFFENEVTEKGYLSYNSRYWNFIDWVPEWTMGTRNGVVPLIEGEAHTLYNMYYACALKNAAYICKKLERNGLAKEYEARWERMVNIIMKCCYDAENEMFRDGSKTQTYSMHTIIWAVLSDTVSKEDAVRLLDKLTSRKMSKASFSMNYFLFRALEKSGKYNLAFKYFDQWQKMLDNNCTTWCENPDSPRSECHGWSSAPLYEFSANILGVKLSMENEVLIKPVIGELSYAKGHVPSRFGDIYISWTIRNMQFEIEVISETNVVKKLFMPNGELQIFRDKKISFSCQLPNSDYIVSKYK